MKTKLVAHRGESESAPENTLEAFELAWLRGARCIEGDFHLSSDGEIVCMHDDNANRTCGVARFLAQMTVPEIKKLDAGLHKGGTWRYTRVPLLREILDRMPHYGEIYIELKSVGPIVEALRKLFACGKWRAEQLTFIAFDETTASAVKKIFPQHKVYWLFCNWIGDWDNRGAFKYSPEELAAKLLELGVDGVDIEVGSATREYIDAVHRAGLTFHVWTVDDAATAARLIADGADSITSNRQYALRNELADAGELAVN